ncbi:MAG: hypothetical protein ABIO71_00830 [Caldimonas sp.]
MKKPASAAPAPSDADRPVGGRASQRVRQFELQRGIAAAPAPAKAVAAPAAKPAKTAKAATPAKTAARHKPPDCKTP